MAHEKLLRGLLKSGRQVWLFTCATLGVALAPTVLAQDAVEDAPWMWPESRWREAVERVRAGPRLLPES